MYTFINVRCAPGVYAPMYKNEKTGNYVVSVFDATSMTNGKAGTYVDHVFETRSKANTFREGLRK